MGRSVRLRAMILVSLLAAGGGLFAAGAAAAPRKVVFDQNTGLGGRGIYQHESSVAVNPANSQNVVIGFPDVYGVNFSPQGDCRASFTLDGGDVWHQGGVVPLVQHPGAANVYCADPSVAADSQGNFYLAYLNVNTAYPFYPPTDIFVAKSTDGGNSFSSYAVAVPGESGVNDADKSYIAADNQPGSPYRGSLYVAWTDFGATYGIKSVFSRDGGQTWSTPVLVSPPLARNWDITGAVPVVAPDGTVYIFSSSWPYNSARYLSITYAKSRDGGITWSKPAVVASRLPSPGFFNLKNADPAFGTDPYTGLIGNSFPTAAIAPDGTIYVAWTDFPAGTCWALDAYGDWACSNADVRLSVSRNAGKSWSAPVKVSDEGAGGTDQFYPWIATHPDGLLSLAWIDRRLDPNNVDYNAFYTNTSDGVHFLPNVRVSGVTSILGLNGFIGDYIGLGASATRVFPVWGDFRFDAVTDFTAKGTLKP